MRQVALKATPDNAAKYEAFAKRAETGEFDDYADTYICPITQLFAELNAAGFAKFAARVARGEFDATKEESDEWAQPLRASRCPTIDARDARAFGLGSAELGERHVKRYRRPCSHLQAYHSRAPLVLPGIPHHLGEDPEGRMALKGGRTDTRLHFGWVDRLRLLTTGRLMVSTISHYDTPSPSIIKTRVDWKISAPGERS